MPKSNLEHTYAATIGGKQVLSGYYRRTDIALGLHPKPEVRAKFNQPSVRFGKNLIRPGKQALCLLTIRVGKCKQSLEVPGKLTSVWEYRADGYSRNRLKRSRRHEIWSQLRRRRSGVV